MILQPRRLCHTAGMLLRGAEGWRAPCDVLLLIAALCSIALQLLSNFRGDLCTASSQTTRHIRLKGSQYGRCFTLVVHANLGLHPPGA